MLHDCLKSMILAESRNDALLGEARTARLWSQKDLAARHAIQQLYWKVA